MGFTAVEGLPMGTRSGSIDPGVLLFLLDEMKLAVRDLERLLYHESGLLGMSGISSDMRDLLASDEPAAKLAVDVFVYRATRELGSLAAALGGAGRDRVHGRHRREPARDSRADRIGGALARRASSMKTANRAGRQRISAESSAVAAYVVPTDEELMIARHVASLLRR